MTAKREARTARTASPAVHAGMVQEISPAPESVRAEEMRAVVNASA